MKARIVFHVVAVLVLVAAVAAAQSPEQKSKPAAQGQSQDRESSSPSVSEREAGSGLATGRRQHEDVSAARETGSGMATGRKSGSIIVLDRESSAPAISEAGGVAPNQRPHTDLQAATAEKNSAHATESLGSAKMNGAQSNPMYKDGGRQGTNPLFESKDKSAAAPSGNGSKPGVVEYKDGEDPITHSRPGSHKTSK